MKDDQPPVPPRPNEGPGEKEALDAAGAWLDTAILRDARAFFLGEERTYNVDQNAGRLTLNHADGWTVDLDIQILASFRPRNRSFRWSWANTSVDPMLAAASIAARDHASTQAFASFRTPTFMGTFEDCVQLAALAARLGGCDGVYRCLTEESLTVFAGYRSPAGVAAPPASDMEKAALALVETDDAEMLPIDEEFYRRRKDTEKVGHRDLSRELLDRKKEIYARHWRRDDDYWAPCSFGWPSEHDPAEQLRKFAVPRRAGGVYVITQKRSIGQRASVVTAFDDGLRITDQDIGWGAGVLLSRPER